MLFPKEIESKLGFDKLRDLLREKCAGEYGKRNVDKIQFLSRPDLIAKLCSQTAECMMMIRSGESLPPLSYPDTDHLLEKLRIDGIFLEPQEMADLLKSLRIQHGWKIFLRGSHELYPQFAALEPLIFTDTGLIKKIEGCIDDHGQVKDSASPELRKIRSEILRQEQLARKTLDRMLRDIRKTDMSPEDSSLTVRNGRLVIPVKAEFKRSVKGFVHDSSASGNIIFIEPAEVLEINNDLKELSYSEKREIIRILTALTKSVQEHLEPIGQGMRFLGIIDLIRAKALLAISQNAIVPETNNNGKIVWHRAINPVLKNALDLHQKPVVPLDFRLDRQKRILIISGPNAGGKSVCLKTVGLLQYMFQCGLPVPAGEGSSTSIFKDLFIDIGDDQSIEDDLSTYSSHLKSMNFLLKHSSGQMLFLIDEFGSGTDPQFGGAIAEAMLEKLIETQAMGIITTHYNNLKKLAESHAGIVNGRMRFDVEKLEPLYLLEIGRPGSSFALEIAGKIGIPKPLLQTAREKAGADAVSLEKLLGELEAEKTRYEKELSKLTRQNATLEKTIEEYQTLKGDLDDKKKDILNEARFQAKELLSATNQRVENLIRQIRENNAEKESTRRLREEVKEFDRKIVPEKPRKKKETTRVLDGPVVIGDHVRIKGQLAIGEVIAVSKSDAEVLFGVLTSKIKLGRLEKVSKGEKKKTEKEYGSAVKGINMVERRAKFTHDLDVRGKRAEEALTALDRFLDDAILFGTNSARIIHGKGDGILRTVLREALKSRREVKHYHDEHADRGGAGITVVELK